MSPSEKNTPKQDVYQPNITDMVSLELPTQVKVSPDGRRVAYAVRTTNWHENRYETLCYVHDIAEDRSFQLTRSGSVTQFEWIDNNSLAVAKSENDGEAQIWLFEHLIGEGVKVTEHKGGVQSFKAFADGVLFLAENPDRAEKKPQAEEFGTFTHFEQEESASALYYVNLPRIKAYQKQLKKVTEGQAEQVPMPVLELSKILDEPLKIVDFCISPLNDAVYFNCRSRDDLVFWDETTSYRLVLDAEKALEEFAERERAKKEGESGKAPSDVPSDLEEDLSYLGELTQIALPKGATIAAVAPDGGKLLIRHKARDNMFYTQSDVWLLDLTQTEGVLEDVNLLDYMRNISEDLDQEIMHLEWVESGIFAGYASGTKTEISQLTESGVVNVLDIVDQSGSLSHLWQFHASESGVLGFVGTNETTFPEVFIALQSRDASWKSKRLTRFGDSVAEWDLGTVEAIRWTSKDGTEIEGVLHKPSDFDPSEKYPLVFVVHGGPAWFSRAFLLDLEDINYYPSVQFNQRGILVLKPNYRGSTGRGQAFLELNKNNLGIGDLEDLESAIEYLDAQGFIDTTRVGCMGWSQGGYISAFVTTHSDKFRAVSVGAGVSDWYTYHIANDIPQFTTHYLSGTPFQNRELYVKTAPMSKIKEAKTPTLIQHGAQDKRVPLASAMELYRGLKDMGVHAELFVFPEMAHPITKPRENRAIMWQNLTWFCHYLLGEALDFTEMKDDEAD